MLKHRVAAVVAVALALGLSAGGASAAQITPVYPDNAPGITLPAQLGHSVRVVSPVTSDLPEPRYRSGSLRPQCRPGLKRGRLCRPRFALSGAATIHLINR